MTSKNAVAEWKGDLESGKGSIHYGAENETEGQYSYASRFEDGEGISPEDLIAAAHASCFSMALANLLSEKVMVPQKVRTFATVSLEKVEEGFVIPRICLETHVHALGLDAEKLREFAETAKKECPVSKALAGADISVEAILENSLT